MDNFDAVLMLGRLALEANGERARHQLQRLRDALAVSDKEQAAKLTRLLAAKGRTQSMAPMAFDEMRAGAETARRQLPGEVLSHATPLPHDKETGAPLATIWFTDGEEAERPILDEGLSSAIDDLLSEWSRFEELERIGARPHTRCLIYGCPGVGKTKLAHFIAQKLDLPCVEARLDGLVSSFLGTTARNIGALFDFANRYRCVLLLDEFDAIAKARDDTQEIGEIKRVVNTLLQSLDRRNGRGFTIAATNHEHLLDPAVWRRFDARIHVPLPDRRTRAQLLSHFSSPLGLQEAEKQFLSWVTEGMSGADIELLIGSVKRFVVLHGSGSPDRSPTRDAATRGRTLMEAVRRQAHLNARLFHEDQRRVLLSGGDELGSALLAADLTQKEVGRLLGLSQSAVSRRQKAGVTSDEGREPGR